MWGGGGRVQDVVLLGVVHVVEGLHGAADLLAGHLLIEGVDKAVGAGAILPGDDEGVELGLAQVRLRPERQAFGHAQLRGGGKEGGRRGRRGHRGVGRKMRRKEEEEERAEAERVAVCLQTISEQKNC